MKNYFQFRRSLMLGLSTFALTSVSTFAQTSSFPSKPVRILVPFPAGGSADSLVRILSQFLSKRWGQSVVIENRPGGGTVIAGFISDEEVRVKGFLEARGRRVPITFFNPVSVS
jgi:hypothetical protein